MAGRLTVADAAVALHADWASFQREVSTQGTTQAKTAGQKISQALGPTGLAKSFTAAGVAAGAIFTGAIGGAVNFEDQLRTINTVAHLTDAELAGVGDSILGLSKETGKSTDDLTAGFYDLVSAGVPAKDAINVLRSSAKLATGALATTAESVDLVTSAMNAYGLKAGDSTRITDIFAQAVADGKVTAGELGQSIASIAPLAASSGVALEEVSAAAAVMTAKGSSASEAFTTMRQAISALLTPNETLIDIQKRTGLAFADVAREKGLAVALEELRIATNGNNEEFAKALGSTQAYQFALASTGENAAAYAAELDKVTTAADKGGVAQAQYDERMKSAKQQGQKLLAQIHALGVEIGGPFTELLGPGIAAVGSLGQGIHGLFILGSGLGGILGRFLGGAWTKVAGSSAVTALIKAAGSKAATAYLSALIAGEGIQAGLSQAWQSIQSSGPVKGAASKAGDFMGSTLGKAASVAFAGVLVFEAIDTFNRVKEQTAAQGAAIGSAIGEQIATGTVDQLKQSRDAVIQGINDLSKIPDFGLITGDAKANLLHQLDVLNAEMADRARKGAPGFAAAGADIGDHLGDGIGDGLKSKTGDLTTAMTLSINGAFGSDLAARSSAAKAVGYRAAADTAAGMKASRETFDQGWQTFLDALKNVETPAKRAARLIGRLSSKELAKGLQDGRPEVRLEAEAAFQATIDELGKIVESGGKIGTKGMNALKAAMHSKNPEIAAAARAIYNAAHTPIAKLPAAGKTAGQGAGAGVVTGLNSKGTAVYTAAAALATKIGTALFARLSYMSSHTKDDTALPHYATGTPYVPYDQVAMVHRGERILTAAENAAVGHGQLSPAGSAGTSITQENHFAIEIHADKDVSPAAARTFGQAVGDEVAQLLREQNRRLTGAAARF